MPDEIAPVLRDPDSSTFALLDGAADEAIAAGNFGSIFPALVSKSKGRENLLYKGFFTGDYASWDPRRSLSFDDEQRRSQLQRQDHQRRVVEQERDRDDNQEKLQVVLKRLNSSKSAIHDIVREASNLYKVQGPRNIVSLYTLVSSHGRRTSLVMEKVDGGSLKNFLRSRRHSSSLAWWKNKVEIFREVVLAVMHCHRNGVYHGDIKGENIVMDKFSLPKLVDFGLSFREPDLNYVKSLAFSWFWAAPEILESSARIDPEVEKDPYPSDIYSLGMLLVEMSLDGDVPELVSAGRQDFKFMDGPVEPFLVRDEEEVELKNILSKLELLVDDCCMAERTERISLEGCLAKVDEVYQEICNLASASMVVVDTGSSLPGWNETMSKLQELYPGVPDCVFYQLDKNLMLNPQGELLIHALCKVDCWRGVRHLTDETKQQSWNFRPSEDVPSMLLLAVTSGALAVLKFLSERWRHIAVEQWVLVHEACRLDRPDLLRFLIFDLDLPCDTWGRERETLMPVHKLARNGKTEMIAVILERSPELVDVFVDPYKCRTALYYAAKRDDVKTVAFLIEKGGGVFVPRGKTGRSIDLLLATACRKGCLKVLVSLLDWGNRLGLDSIAGIRLDDCSSRFDALKSFVAAEGSGSDLRGLCRRGNEDGFEAFVWMFFHCSDYSFSSRSMSLTKVTDLLLKCVCEKGSVGMIELLVETMSSEAGTEIWRLGHLENPGLTTIEVYIKAARENGNEQVERWLLAFEAKLEKGEEPSYSMSEKERSAWEEETNFEELMELPSRAIKDGDLEGFEALATGVVGDRSDEQLVTKFFERCAELCCRNSRPEMLHFLVSRLGLPLDHPRVCVLHRAAFHGELDIIRYVLKRNVAVDATANHFGIENTALLCASQRNQIEAMKLLLEKPTFADAHGWRAMDDALLEQNWDMVRLLIRWGFDTSAKNRDNVRYMTLIANRHV